jgi:hypothetical protein
MPSQSALDEFAELANQDLPTFYFNSFQNAGGTADITTILQRNGKAVCVLNMSFTTAKTFSVLLGQIIASIEADTGQDIMTTQRIEAAARKAGRVNTEDDPE